MEAKVSTIICLSLASCVGVPCGKPIVWVNALLLPSSSSRDAHGASKEHSLFIHSLHTIQHTLWKSKFDFFRAVCYYYFDHPQKFRSPVFISKKDGLSYFPPSLIFFKQVILNLNVYSGSAPLVMTLYEPLHLHEHSLITQQALPHCYDKHLDMK